MNPGRPGVIANGGILFRFAFGDQILGQVLNEFLHGWPLSLDIIGIAAFGYNVSIERSAHHKMKEYTTPPFFGPVVNDVVPDHLIRQVHASHVPLIIRERAGNSDRHLFRVARPLVDGSLHGRVMVVGQAQYRSCVLPHGEGQLVILSHSVLVLLQSEVFG